MKDRLTTAPLPLERPKRNWNRLQPLEQSLWLYLERPQGYFVLFVGRRYYLRPNPLRSPPLRPLERAKRYWNGLRPLGTPAGG